MVLVLLQISVVLLYINFWSAYFVTQEVYKIIITQKNYKYVFFIIDIIVLITLLLLAEVNNVIFQWKINVTFKLCINFKIKWFCRYNCCHYNYKANFHLKGKGALTTQREKEPFGELYLLKHFTLLNLIKRPPSVK